MKDTLANLDEHALDNLGADLGVSPRGAESLDAYRVRVALAFNDDAAVDAAVPITTPARPMVLGGMSLGKV